MNDELISVIVTVYNCEKYLAECIESVLNQTYKNLELILVDDGSLDDSIKICDRYAQSDERVKVIHKENGGVSSARNVGIEKAIGKFLTFIDSDDYIDDSMLYSLLNRLVYDGSDLAVSGLRYIDELSKKERNYILPNATMDVRKDFNQYYKSFLENNALCSQCAKLYRMQILKDNNIKFNEKISILEDGIFVVDYLKCCKKISVLSEIFYSYRQYSSDSLVKRFNNNSIYALSEKYERDHWFIELLDENNIADYYGMMYFYLSKFIDQLYSVSGLSKNGCYLMMKSYFKNNVIHIIFSNYKPYKETFKNKVVYYMLKNHLLRLYNVLMYKKQ